MSAATAVAAIEGWYTLDDPPHLIGSRCRTCGTYFFPRQGSFCRNPACEGVTFEDVKLSRTGKVWSYTNACYQPPPPFVAPVPFVPFAIAAVELAAERMIVLGQVSAGIERRRPARRHGHGAGARAAVRGGRPARSSSGSGGRCGGRSEPRGRGARRRHAPLGQVGPQLRRVRRACRARGAQGRRRPLAGRAVHLRRGDHALRLPGLRGGRDLRAGPGLAGRRR